MATINGTYGDDSLFGTDAADDIFGLEGDDTLEGGRGNDTLVGGDGDDLLWGQGGTDVLDGGDGLDIAVYRDNTSPVRVDLVTDTVSFVGTTWANEQLANIEGAEGGSGNDILIGDGGANRFLGGAGDDSLRGGFGADTLDGGAGKDTLDGGNGPDVASYASQSVAMTVNLGTRVAFATGAASTTRDALVSIEAAIGGSGADLMLGGGGSDALAGGGGNDTLRGAGGDDRLTGGYLLEPAHYDREPHFSDDGVDLIDGGAGRDTVVVPEVSYYDAGESIEGAGYISANINLNFGTMRMSYGPSVDRLVSIENVLTGAGNDAVNGSAAANWIGVGDGANIVYAGGGDDTVVGGSAVYDGDGDLLNGGNGDDLIRGNGSRVLDWYGLGYAVAPGTDTLDGGAGDDSLYAGPSFVDFTGGSGADEFHFSDEEFYYGYKSDWYTYFAHVVIEDFSRSEGDRVFIHMDETGATPEFVGATRDLELHQLGYHTEANADGGVDTVAHLRLRTPEDGYAEFLEVRFANYDGGLTSDDFAFV